MRPPERDGGFQVRRLLVIFLCALGLAACTTLPVPAPIDPTISGPKATAPVAAFVPDTEFRICPGLRVRNAPASDREGYVQNYAQLVVYENRIAIAPVPLNGGCLSSGVGIRNGRLHKALDISAPRGTWVYSGAPGIVREAGWGGGYGNYVLVEHGYGLFTRYAHLNAFAEGLSIGLQVDFGVPLGSVGNTSSQRIGGPHLHYEVLVGDYNTPRKSFGLQVKDPLTFPAYVPPTATPLS